MQSKSPIMRLVLVIVSLVLTLTGEFYLVIIGFSSIISLAVYNDRSAFRKLGKPRFWLFSIVVILLAGMLLGKNPRMIGGIPFSSEGFQAGLMMNLRAFTLVLGFVLITRTISQDRFLNLTTRIGLPHYVPAFQTALSTLGQMKDSFNNNRSQGSLLRFDSLVNILLMAKQLSCDPSLNKVRIFGITGKRMQGKTTLIKKIHIAARNRGIAACGFVQERCMDQDGKTTSYNLVSLRTGEEVVIAQKNDSGGFSFNDEAFDLAAKWLTRDCTESPVILVDEMGMLESQGKGHTPGVLSAIGSFPDKTWVMTLRKDKLLLLRDIFRIDEKAILDLDKSDADVEGFVEDVILTFNHQYHKVHQAKK